MAIVPHSQVFSSAIKYGLSSTNPFPKIRTLKISASSTPNSEDKTTPDTEPETDPVKLAFAKAKAYKKQTQSPITGESLQNNSTDTQNPPNSLQQRNEQNDFIRNENGENGESDRNALPKQNASKKEELTISSIDFVGLNFSDKKQSRGLPAGLVPVVDPFPGGDLPDVEILVGDTSKFGDNEVSKLKRVQEDDTNTYKPKVSTWGVFPRPNNISKTFGGGRNLRPGEALESAEEKAAKEARTRELLAAYKRRVGLSIDPDLKLECEKALKDGDSFMELGKLREALPFYEKVMDKLTFQTELHGLAALQWSICQDSLRRSDDARLMYEKLQSHPNVQVSKKARQFMFSFQAMDMMKVTGSTLSSKNTGYQNYFNAFIRDKVDYSLNEDELGEDATRQAVLYVVFLLFPVFIVLLIAGLKGV